ncbi:transposable element Tcb2 transposase [Trichonephila clavipes]|nr:transposable element Tcb2 transposase [Trichonephila clavipes]
MRVRPGSTYFMAGQVVFLRGLLSPIRVVDLTPQKPSGYGEGLVGGVSRVRILGPLKTYHVEELMHVKFVEAQSPPFETQSAGRRPGQGRRRATTPNEDRYLVLTARRHRNMNATLLQQHLRSATGTMVSTQTVRNWLHGVGLYARRPLVCVKLTSRHRRDRREDEILRPISVPYAAAIGDDFILMDDKCRPHRANLVEDFIFEEGIVRME